MKLSTISQKIKFRNNKTLKSVAISNANTTQAV